jgi:hypothetical protein
MPIGDLHKMINSKVQYQDIWPSAKKYFLVKVTSKPAQGGSTATKLDQSKLWDWNQRIEKVRTFAFRIETRSRA